MTTVVVIDSSAIVAIFLAESDANELFARAMRYERRVMSASTWLECAIVCEGKVDRGGGERFDGIADALNLEVLPFSPEQAVLAREAFKRYGKGRQAKASLSFGDCFAYALANDLNAPLLYKGNDFAQTDVRAA